MKMVIDEPFVQPEKWPRLGRGVVTDNLYIQRAENESWLPLTGTGKVAPESELVKPLAPGAKITLIQE